MIIGIFSDAHDNVANIAKTRDIFIREKVEQAIFCGDLVSPFTLKFIANWPIPIKAVFGNNEGDKWGIKRRFKSYSVKNIEYGSKSGLFFGIELAGIKIAVFHGHIKEFTDLLVSSDRYDLVCTGHTHEPHIKTIGNTTWINPGAVTGVSENPSIVVGSIAVYDTTSKKAKIINLK